MGNERQHVVHPGRAATWAAVGVLVFFGVVVVVLLALAGRSTNDTWTRLMYIYSGLEAVVFAAAGLLFGSSLYRGRVAAADSKVTTLEGEIKTVRDEVGRQELVAQAGLALFDIIETLPAGAGASSTVASHDVSEPRIIGAAGAASPSEWSQGEELRQYLKEVARRLFERAGETE